MQSASDRQAGNIVAFLIVGVVLASLLGVGIYVSKQQGRVASRTDTVSVNSNDQSKNTVDQAPATNEEEGEAEEAAPTPTPTPAQPQPSQSQTQAPTTTSGSTSSRVPQTGPSSIASTGPEDGMMPVIMIGLLTAGIFAYVRSKRSLRTSALK